MAITREQSGRRTSRTATPSRRFLEFCVAVLPVFACFLGGATEKWSEGLVLVFFGVLLLVAPPRHSLGIWFTLVVVTLVACAAIPFLPARWFYEPDWRTALLNDFAVPLPRTLSSQPWATLQCLVSFAAGLTWLYYVCARNAEPRDVRFQLRSFAAAVTCLAAFSILLYLTKHPLLFWHNQRSFGPFPNRNQTADLLAITSVVVLAAGFEEITKRRLRWLFWAVAIVVLVTAIVLNYSRAGMLLLVAGVALWLGLLVVQRGSATRVVLGLCVVLALLTCLLLFGGQTLERFHLRDGTGISRDFRWLIFRDAVDLVRHSPWCGIGLGNFEPVFAVFRAASSNDTRAHHPESDWIWFWSEAGWIALAVAIGGAVYLLVRAYPRKESRNHRFRLAALVGAVLFAVHGGFDVSAHRVGSAFAALLLIGAAMPRPNKSTASRVVPVIFRALGALLIGIGGTWTYAARAGLALPGSAGAEQLRNDATRANRSRDFRSAVALSTRALAWTPLDWQLYFVRAVAFANENQPQPALSDFRSARFLEPNAWEVPLEEGRVWAASHPQFALVAWREALRRAGSDRAEVFRRMLRIAEQINPRLLGQLEQLSHTHGELVLAFLERLRQEPFQQAVDHLLGDDPDLRAIVAASRPAFFAMWIDRGDLGRLVEELEQHPEWEPFAWRGVAKFRAGHGDFGRAVALALRFTARPALPQSDSAASTDELQRAIAADPQNYAAGFALFARQQAEGRMDDALNTLRHFTAHPGAPAYFSYLEAEAWAHRQDWQRAWDAWQRYDAVNSATVR